jgi:hypothetical protein
MAAPYGSAILDTTDGHAMRLKCAVFHVYTASTPARSAHFRMSAS